MRVKRNVGITIELVEKCLARFRESNPSCLIYQIASQHWLHCGGDVGKMLAHPGADGWRYRAARGVEGLSVAQRWTLVRDIAAYEWRYMVARDVEGLSVAQRWALVRGITTDGYWRYMVARDVEGLSVAQRWTLVRDIAAGHWRNRAACVVPGLSDNQRAELRGEAVCE